MQATMPVSPLPHAVIVKLGGSLTDSGLLGDLLAHFATAGAPHIVVAGGGHLADAVRDLQPRLAFSEEAAHHMAILAMEQMALACADREPRLVPCADPDAIAHAHGSSRAALWLPATMARLTRDLPASWDVTSDSLALWLGIKLGAKRVLLVKSAPVEEPNGPVQNWVRDGLVDPHMGVLAARFAGRLEAASAKDILTRRRQAT